MRKKKYLFVATTACIIAAACVTAFALWPKTTTTTSQATTSEQDAAVSTPATDIVFYVSPTGSDSNPGTLDEPFQTIDKAVSLITAGTIIYLCGGTYTVSAEIDLLSSGTDGNPICIEAYNDEKPVLDFSSEKTGEQGIVISGDYWYIAGLEIEHAGHHGMHISGSHNKIENVSSHDNRDSGFFVGLGKTDSNDGSKASYNSFIDCDSYLNVDIGGSTGDGGNADGFSCKLNPGEGNHFYGCRSWENSDDGWDCYESNYPITIEDCYTWHNGDPASFGYTGDTWAGNGNGFKAGGDSDNGAHVLIDCVAFDMNYGKSGNHHKAFDENGNLSGVTLYNCLAFDSETGFSFNTTPDDGTHHMLANCVAFGCSTDELLAKDSVQENNGWNLGLLVDTSDFVTLDVDTIESPRNADGTLVDDGFAKPTATSLLVDAGIDVGLPYSGKAPDLGAVEIS
jgi:hypothetical protein